MQQHQVYVHVTLMHLDSFAIFGAHMILLDIARCFELNWSLTHHAHGPNAMGGLLLHAHASLIVLASRAAVSHPHVSYSFPLMIVCLLI